MEYNICPNHSHNNTPQHKTSKHDILFLSLEDVLDCGGSDIGTAAKEIKEGFTLLSANNILQPFKTTLKSRKTASKSEGLVNFLPAYINHCDDNEIFGCKILGAMPSNTKKGIPRATGVIILCDSQTKSPLCIMDAQVISATRTGAVTALAAERLADKKTSEIGLVGAGVNMRTQFIALSMVLPKLERAYVYSRGLSKYDFALKMKEKTGIEVIPVNSAEKAVKGRDLIVTCLPNILTPVVKASWVKKRGVTCINIGCYEMEASLLKNMDRIVADMWQQGKHRGVQTHAQAVTQGVIDEHKIEDLTPIITGKTPGRKTRKENIFFVPTGLGFEDILVAWKVYQNALKKRIGTKVNLWSSSRWI